MFILSADVSSELNLKIKFCQTLMRLMRSVKAIHGQATQPLFSVTAGFAHIAAGPGGNSPYCHELEDIVCGAQMGLQNIAKHISKEACYFNAHNPKCLTKLNKHRRKEFHFKAQFPAEEQLT